MRNACYTVILTNLGLTVDSRGAGNKRSLPHAVLAMFRKPSTLAAIRAGLADQKEGSQRQGRSCATILTAAELVQSVDARRYKNERKWSWTSSGLREDDRGPKICLSRGS
jgi:hypothetical protein